MSTLTVNESPSPATWLARWQTFRRQSPVAPLADCFDGELPPSDMLVDLLCMDLMHMWRQGSPVQVESYASAFAILADDESLLDLIDAEICVREEIGQTLSITQWQKRFPNRSGEIDSLLRMDDSGATDRPERVSGSGEDRTDRSATSSPISNNADQDFSFDAPAMPGGDELKTQFSIAMMEPEDPRKGLEDITGGLDSVDAAADESVTGPDWFVGQRMIATRPGCWIVRGLHRDTNRSMALKVVQLRSTVTPPQIRGLMDVVGDAAMLEHAGVVVPASSTVRNEHLAVLRPWVEGRPWEDSLNALGRQPDAAWRMMAQWVFGISSGLGKGVFFGGIHASNLIVTHDRHLRVMDVGSSRRGTHRLLSTHEFPTRATRGRWDFEDMAAVVAQAAIAWKAPGVLRWLTQRVDPAQRAPRDRSAEDYSSWAAELAEVMIQVADGDPIARGGSAGPSTSWRWWRS